MKVMLDTNVAVDILEKREPFFQKSYEVFQLAASGTIEGIVSAGSITDIFYIIRKSVTDADKARDAIIGLTELVGICDTTANDINTALTMNIKDFEDAVLAAAAKRERADFIVTRNARDFTNSPVKAVEPDEFLRQYLNRQ